MPPEDDDAPTDVPTAALPPVEVVELVEPVELVVAGPVELELVPLVAREPVVVPLDPPGPSRTRTTELVHEAAQTRLDASTKEDRTTLRAAMPRR